MRAALPAIQWRRPLVRLSGSLVGRQLCREEQFAAHFGLYVFLVDGSRGLMRMAVPCFNSLLTWNFEISASGENLPTSGLASIL